MDENLDNNQESAQKRSWADRELKCECPPVDTDLVIDFAEGRLSKGDTQRVSLLCEKWKAWSDTLQIARNVIEANGDIEKLWDASCDFVERNKDEK